jgi:hypothetical protein
MHYCGIPEHEALFRLPYVRGLQYIHAALLSQGAHCIRKTDTCAAVDAIVADHSALVKQYLATP